MLKVNMEMPKDCMVCPFCEDLRSEEDFDLFNLQCYLTKEDINYRLSKEIIGRSDKCPLKEIEF